jgi:processive 1,2-diacylglycerol beta-glucosyltransferase
VWAFIYGLIDRFPLVEFSMPLMKPVEERLAQLFTEKSPSAVVSVYPAFAYLIAKLFPSGRPFAFHTVVTDSITINRVWHRAPSDCLIAPNAATGEVLRAQGVPASRVRELGFPVSPRFAVDRPERPDPSRGGRVLFMINAGKQMAPSVVDRLLDVRGIHLTVTVGRDEELRRRVEEAAAGRPMEIHGWTQQMPELLMTHHVLIGKAGGAAVQETIAAQTPMLITQVVPGQEEGNAELLFAHRCAALCSTPESLALQIEKLFEKDARQWRDWHQNIRALSVPTAAFDIARFVVESAGRERIPRLADDQLADSLSSA